MDSKGAGVLDSFVGALSGAIVDVGRAGLHVLGPDNFEYYMCSLSLRTHYMKEVAYMSFPVMPNNIMESQQAVASITKTNNGIVTQFNSSFNPKDISIQGTFGRKLRLILGNKEFVPQAAAGFAMAQKFFNGNIGINGGIAGTDILIKTGFGLTKMMQRILDAAYSGDEDGPYIIVFTNYAFNTSYIVEPLQRSFSQSTENNMLWYYNVEMKAIADWSDLSMGENIGKFMGQVAANAVSNTLTKVLNSAMRLIAL
jgi:hypothetical protein